MNNLKSLFTVKNINYGDELIKSFIVTSFAKKKFNYILLVFINLIIKIHLYSLLCLFINFNIYIDFFLHIIISIILTTNNHYLFKAILKYEKETYLITKYIINNFNFTNFRLWKKYILLLISIYTIIILLFIDLNSKLIIIWIIQYLISFFIIDQLEQNLINTIIKKIKKPKLTVYKKINILENYLEQNIELEEDYKNNNILKKKIQINENFIFITDLYN